MSVPDLQIPNTYNIIHVDDDSDQLKIVKRSLEKTAPNFDVNSFSAPVAALKAMKTPPDCILSDYKMPKMDGLSFVRKVRETSDVPFILYTGKGSDEIAEAAFQAGVNDYLRKESDSGHYLVLAERIRTAIEGHRAEVCLRDTKAQNLAILDCIPGDVFLIDPYDYTVVAANRSFLSKPMMGGEGVLGSPCYEILHHRTSPCEASDYVCPLNEMMETGQDVTVVHTHYDIDGNQVYEEVSTHPVRDAEGAITQLLHIRKMIEAQVPGEVEADVKTFLATTRYLASSLIVTVPMRIVRQLGLGLGESVDVQIKKKASVPRTIGEPEVAPLVRRDRRL